MKGMPLEIELRLKSMKAHIAEFLDVETVNRFINDELDKQIANLDFGQVLKNAVEAIICDSIESYFKFGEGHKIITLAVTERLRQILENDKQNDKPKAIN